MFPKDNPKLLLGCLWQSPGWGVNFREGERVLVEFQVGSLKLAAPGL